MHNSTPSRLHEAKKVCFRLISDFILNEGLTLRNVSFVIFLPWWFDCHELVWYNFFVSLFLRSTRVPFVFKEGEGINQSEKHVVAKIAALGANMINELTGALLRKVCYMSLKVFRWDRQKSFKTKLIIFPVQSSNFFWWIDKHGLEVIIWSNFQITVESTDAFVIVTQGASCKNLALMFEPTRSKGNRTLYARIFPRFESLGIQIGSSRCTHQLLLVEVIALLLVFRKSFENALLECHTL